MKTNKNKILWNQSSITIHGQAISKNKMFKPKCNVTIFLLMYYFTEKQSLQLLGNIITGCCAIASAGTCLVPSRHNFSVNK